jgi:hypothetical protein
MRMPMKSKIVAVVGAGFLACTHLSFACKIFEEFSASVPTNTVGIGNADRVRLAEAVIRARTWPDVEIGAEVSAPAFASEDKPKALSSARTDAIDAYLVQLGVKKSNIFSEPRVISNPEARNREGLERLREIYVSLAPICPNGCDRLCNDPRVIPVSKAIK